jgi:hypothetical protein
MARRRGLFGPREFRGGQVRVYGCAPGCLLACQSRLAECSQPLDQIPQAEAKRIFLCQNLDPNRCMHLVLEISMDLGPLLHRSGLRAPPAGESSERVPVLQFAPGACGKVRYSQRSSRV